MLDHSADSAETEQLLSQIKAGQRDAFDKLFERHRDRLRRAVELRLDRRLTTRFDASDVVQDAQVEAFRRLDDYLQRRPMPFALWLRKTAQERLANLRRDHLHTKKRSVAREQPLPEGSSMLIAGIVLSNKTSLSRRVLKREFSALVVEAVGELAETDREILLMRHVEGLSHQDIASVLEVSCEALRKRYGRALLKLQRLLANKGIVEPE